LDEAAKINENGRFVPGLDRFECREKLWSDMKKAGLVIKEEKYMTTIPRSQRGGRIIEPMMLDPMVRPRSSRWAKAALRSRERTEESKSCRSDSKRSIYNWLENIKDWCISRQLWWGHRIPVWYCPGRTHDHRPPGPGRSAGTCGSAKLTQDPDVLDTHGSLRDCGRSPTRGLIRKNTAITNISIPPHTWRRV